MDKSLAFQEIKELIRGAVSITQTPDGICMQRFTGEQLHVYDNNKDFQTKAQATSGMTLDFITDASRIVMNYKIGPGSSRVFSNIDVTVNGELAAFHCVPDFNTEPESVLDFTLDGKENHVRIYLPCLTQLVMQSLTFHDVTVLKPVHRKNIMLAYGDSITQGYDAQHPMGTYAMLVADAFHADLYNKAIGGDRFCTALTETRDDFDPTFITVAYGTNDWNRSSLEDFQSNTVGFFRNLAANYPDKPIFVILPIWRKDKDRETLCGSFESARDFIRKTAEVYPGVHIIDGLELMAHDVALTSDGYLHPNDEGFQQMGRSLIEKIAPVLNQ